MENLMQLVATVVLRHGVALPTTHPMLNVYNYLSERENLARLAHRRAMETLHRIKFNMHIVTGAQQREDAYKVFLQTYEEWKDAGCATEMYREIYNRENTPYVIGVYPGR
jgi:hypothetical protein